MIFENQCVRCKHLFAPDREKRRGFFCKAYPEGVPRDIVWNKHDHRKPFPGDNGITFEPKEGERSVFSGKE